MVLRIRSQKRNVSMYDTGSFAMCQSVISSRNNRVIGREREGVNSHSSFMGCFGCHFCKSNRKLHRESSQRHIVRTHSVIENQQQVTASCEKEADDEKKVLTFSYSELAAASSNFDPKCFLGEGGFGKVHKGYLEKPNQYVAIKQLDRNGCQGAREFIVEVLTLSLADHPNLVKLIGYCAERNQRLLVYEYMPLGSLENHLHDLRPGSTGLDWTTRLRIAAGAARGLEYLHKKMNPPVIYRDLKCSNILLGHEYHPKLSDFGLAKVGPLGGKTHVSTRVMGTYGYCAPEYAKTGQLTFKSDIYSFGVVLLEIFTGRKAIDFGRPYKEQNLVAWARPLFKARKNFVEMADPLLKGRFPVKALCQVLYIAAQCIQEKPNMRPSIVDITNALDFLAEKQSP